MRIIFFGSGEFAIPTLERIVQSPALELVTVVTQPDRPAGRHHQLQSTPMTHAAQRLGVPHQTDWPTPELSAPLGIVVYFGRIIPQAVLNQFSHGVLNIHPSLLPAYRGPAPIKQALLNDEVVTGVTIMRLDAGLDTGPIVAQRSLPIANEDSNVTLEKKLAELGADLLITVLPAYLAGTVSLQPQLTKDASYAAPLTRADGLITPNLTPRQIWNMYRALQPWPGIYVEANGQRIKVLEMDWRNQQPVVVKLQPAGKRPMSVAEFKRGYPAVVFPNLLFSNLV